MDKDDADALMTLLAGLFSLGVLLAIIVIAIHFIAKYW